MKRRNFIKTGSLLTAAAAVPSIAFSGGISQDHQIKIDSQRINFTRDGLDFTPAEYSNLLSKLNANGGILIDNYSLGGVVEELEKRMAKILGTECAIFMPTGTLANHLAVRKLAGENRKVLVQSDSHLYRDSGDCANTLSGLNLIPLGKGKVDFNLAEVEEEYLRTKEGRVETQIGVISIESPVRRYNNQLFGFDQMKEISAFARKNNIKMHLDGARLFNACVHTDKSPTDFVKLFDTVYISLYKNFNAASGAILAGKKAFIEGFYHTRRMFGGGVVQVWPFAVVANHYLDSFLSDYKASLKQADVFFDELQAQSDIEINKIPNGSNVFQMNIHHIDATKFIVAMEAKNVFLPAANHKDGFIYFKINPSILRKPVMELTRKFIQGIKEVS